MVNTKTVYWDENMLRDGFTKKTKIKEKKEKKEAKKGELKDTTELTTKDDECPCATCNHNNKSDCYSSDVNGIGCICCSEECT